MNEVPWKELLLLVGGLTAYVAVLRVLTNRAYDTRRQLYELGRELLADAHCDDTDRMMLRHCMDVAMTFRGALWWLLISVYAIGRMLMELFIGSKTEPVHPNVSERLVLFATCFSNRLSPQIPSSGCWRSLSSAWEAFCAISRGHIGRKTVTRRSSTWLSRQPEWRRDRSSVRLGLGASNLKTFSEPAMPM